MFKLLEMSRLPLNCAVTGQAITAVATMTGLRRSMIAEAYKYMSLTRESVQYEHVLVQADNRQSVISFITNTEEG